MTAHITQPLIPLETATIGAFVWRSSLTNPVRWCINRQNLGTRIQKLEEEIAQRSKEESGTTFISDYDPVLELAHLKKRQARSLVRDFLGEIIPPSFARVRAVVIVT